MKQFAAAFFCLLAGVLCLTAGAETTSRDWQAKAIDKYPDLGVYGSQLNKRFVAAYSHRREVNPEFFLTPKWPMILADELAKTPAGQPLDPPTPPPEDKPASPPPSNAPVGAAPAEPSLPPSAPVAVPPVEPSTPASSPATAAPAEPSTPAPTAPAKAAKDPSDTRPPTDASAGAQPPASPAPPGELTASPDRGSTVATVMLCVTGVAGVVGFVFIVMACRRS